VNRVFWRLIRLTAPYWRRMVLATAFGAATIASGIGLLTTSAYIISKAALQPSIAELQIAIVGVRFFGISRAGFRYLERLISHDVNLHLLARLRVWLFRAVEPLAPARLMQAHSADLLTRIAADVETLENLFVRVIAPSLVALTVTAVVTLLILTLAPSLALLFLASLAFGGICLPLTAHRMARLHGRAIVTTRAELNQGLVDAIQGSADLLAFGAAAAQGARIEGLGARLLGLQNRMGSVSALATALSGLWVNLTVLGVLIVSIPLVRTASLDGVMLGVVVLAAISSFEAILPLPVALQYLDNSLSAGRRILELVDSRPLVVDPPAPVPVPPIPAIRVSDLTFRYEPGEAPALQQVSFSIPYHAKVALVGPSGAGKSTLVNLLLRFWEYQTGSIKVGDIELRELAQEDVRRAISLVSQSTYLFNATVRENLLLAQPEASEQEMIEAARQARIHDVICSFPAGYDTWIGERGLQLSGGERQRLAIARAILKRAPILILDEPTANLDAISERQILDQLVHLMRSRTTLLVTHRLLGLQSMDQILVLKDGHLVECGTHEDLLSGNGYYSRMWHLEQLALG
jgi:ATP-binding cassette, subfamily C, bacterial CydC